MSTRIPSWLHSNRLTHRRNQNEDTKKINLRRMKSSIDSVCWNRQQTVNVERICPFANKGIQRKTPGSKQGSHWVALKFKTTQLGRIKTFSEFKTTTRWNSTASYVATTRDLLRLLNEAYFALSDELTKRHGQKSIYKRLLLSDM